MILTDLPLEILHSICASLNDYDQFIDQHGDHWHNEVEEIEADDHNEQTENDEENDEGDDLPEQGESERLNQSTNYGKRSLAALCRVSRSIRPIGEIHLYSFFDGYHHNVGSFFRSLIHNPRYATHVRGIRIEPLEDDRSWAIVDEQDKFRWAVTAFCSIIHQATIVSGDFPAHLNDLPRLRDNALQQEIIAQWLILNLPMLEVLKISIPQNWTFSHLGHIAKFDNNFLQNLRTLHILGPPRREMFYGSPPVVRIDPIVCILNLRNLVDICTDYCIGIGDEVTLVNSARRIAHWRCGTTKCQMGEVLSACTNLQSYELEYGGGIALDLSYLSSSVETLENLEIEVYDYPPNNLTKYSRLKSFTIMTDSIVPRRPGSLPSRGQYRTSPRPPKTLLAKLLPPCIEHICLGSIGGDAAELWQGQLEFLLDNVTHGFVHLKSVEVDWQASEKVRQASSLRGIELREMTNS